jgi:hypothetical protein
VKKALLAGYIVFYHVRGRSSLAAGRALHHGLPQEP